MDRMHRLERRPLAMRRVPTPPGLLATGTGTLATAAFNGRFALGDPFDNPTHILIKAYMF
jgi:hypothetical protein